MTLFQTQPYGIAEDAKTMSLDSTSALRTAETVPPTTSGAGGASSSATATLESGRRSPPPRWSWLTGVFRRNRVGNAPPQDVAGDDEAARLKMRALFVNEAARTQEYAAFMQKKHDGEPYHANAVRTSKYSAINFVPKSLFEQFRRIANFYFLIISLLQLTTNLSPTNEYSTVGPLMLVLLATMVKEGLEDRKRHQQDWVVNNDKVDVLGGLDDHRQQQPNAAKVQQETAKVDGGLVGNASSPLLQPIYWKQLRVGHVVRVYDGGQIPADIVLLESINEANDAMCETSSLDGESNLKVRHCLRWNRVVPRSAEDFGKIIDAEIRCELPNKRLYSFDGLLHIGYKTTSSTVQDGNLDATPVAIDPEAAVHAQRYEEIPISIDNVMLRG